MITLITISLDRAMQLESHLNSFYFNKKGNVDVEHYVLYGATNEKFEEGYKLLINKFRNIKFIKKELGKYRTPFFYFLKYPRNLYWFLKFKWMRDIKKIYNFKELVENIIEKSKGEFIAFSTDDSYIYKEFLLDDDVESILGASDMNFFSFWHGSNLNDSPKDLISIKNKFYSWSLENKEYDRYWRNRFSLDLNIYNKKLLLKLLKKILYVNPNSLEGMVNFYATSKKYFNTGFCYYESPWVMFSLNQVQTNNKHVDTVVIDKNFLNDKFLEGYKLKFKFTGPPNIIDSYPDEIYLENNIEKIKIKFK